MAQMSNIKPLEEMIKDLSPELRHEVEDFTHFLWVKSKTDLAPSKVDKPKQTDPYDFNRFLGIGLQAPLNSNPRFKSDDDLWKDL